MTITLRKLHEAGWLSWTDIHFGATLLRLNPGTPREVELAAAFTSRQVERGHPCLDIRNAAGLRREWTDPEYAAVVPEFPDVEAWKDMLLASPLVEAIPARPAPAGGDAEIVGDTPLVMANGHRLYLRRYFEHERRLVSVLSRLARVSRPLELASLVQPMEWLFPEKSSDPAQRRAALLVLERSLCVITGGPGTGKTTTVGRILLLLAEEARIAGRRPPRMHLAAPTGKAAARLLDSVSRTFAKMDLDPALSEVLPKEAFTLHRLLGAWDKSGARFRYDAQNPLRTDLVLIDEASMVDLALMSRLAAALPQRARLVLLGDKDQLASVEAGAVLGDICTPPARHVHADVPIAQCVVGLTHSWRFGADTALGALAQALRTGDVAAALSLLEDPEQPLVQWVPVEDGAHFFEALEAPAREGYGPFLRAANSKEALEALADFRILCAHRRGVAGVSGVNAWILERFAEWFPKDEGRLPRPIMVTQNDYEQGLFNGDVLVQMGESDQAFLSVPPGVRTLANSRLPPHETVFAMSIHKSQGSEFRHVAVVLPLEPSFVLTRELLYTAVTRASQRVTVFGSEHLLRHALEHPTVRASGLSEALWAP